MIVDIHAHYGRWLCSSTADTPASFAQLLTRCRIDATIVSSARAVQYEIVSGNAETAELVETDPRIYGAIVVNPNHYDASLSELAKYSENDSFIAVKLHPDYCGQAADSAASMAVIAKVAETGKPLFVHTWGSAQIESACAVADKFSGLNVFMFHMGGSHWRLAIERAAERRNVQLEIISTIPEAVRIKEAVEKIGAERVFFGTDMTLLAPEFAVGLVESAGISKQDREKILGVNAMKFFGIAKEFERKRK